MTTIFWVSPEETVPALDEKEYRLRKNGCSICKELMRNVESTPCKPRTVDMLYKMMTSNPKQEEVGASMRMISLCLSNWQEQQAQTKL
eukprot:TRINITY_DN1827_c0_g1_i1.p1 TRINITY_DN1827_c0_g1~~TRINITY_DN1827_c0_g1_i1.p1  ORF type:complete len:100 (+),score=15.87 TRINITY_DN1827_c0_g1_i1:38-301(+)